MFATYVLQSEKSGRFYIGHAEDIIRRLHKHNNGQVTATRNKGPWTLVFQEEFDTRAQAVRRELYIKSKKSRKFIENLILDGGTGRHVPT